MSTELVQLPSFYASPGFLLLATDDGQPVGCVGLRGVDDTTGEIRRLFVHQNAKGKGTGRALMETLISQASATGLRHLILNTVPTMVEAGHLYARLGFEPIPRYHLTTTPGVLYLGLDLPAERTRARQATTE